MQIIVFNFPYMPRLTKNQSI